MDDLLVVQFDSLTGKFKQEYSSTHCGKVGGYSKNVDKFFNMM